MKLWVDDIRQAPDESWTVARTVQSAISAINHFDFDEISLDHDISHQVTVGGLGRPYPCEETFMPVALFIAYKYMLRLALDELPGSGKPVWEPKITIHSSNVVAGEEMKRAMEEHLMSGIIHDPIHIAANRLEMEV